MTLLNLTQFCLNILLSPVMRVVVNRSLQFVPTLSVREKRRPA